MRTSSALLALPENMALVLAAFDQRTRDREYRAVAVEKILEGLLIAEVFARA